MNSRRRLNAEPGSKKSKGSMFDLADAAFGDVKAVGDRAMAIAVPERHDDAAFGFWQIADRGFDGMG